MKLVLTRPLPEYVDADIREVAPDLRIVVAPDLDAVLEEVVDADILVGSFGGGSGGVFERVLAAAPKVKWVHTSSAGVDEVLGPQVLERDFTFTCGKGESVASLLAEHAFALLLALTRGVVKSARLQSWQRDAFRQGVTELRGLTMGIVGFGAVGEALAKRALAFEMRILAIRAHPNAPPKGVDAVVGT
jgi:phosphoglycerate dehydrogenase-like enzyme